MNQSTNNNLPVDESEIEIYLEETGKSAPRLTPDLIDSVIINADYHVFPDGPLTVCALTLKNGFIVTGESAAASPENFDPDLGKQIAFTKARDKIWLLEGYLLKEKLYNQDQLVQD